MGFAQPGDVPQQGVVGADFSSDDCGEHSGNAQGGALLAETGWLAINGSTDLSSCIESYSVATVQQLFMSNEPPEPVLSACIWVYGQGPEGAGSGSLELVFTDQDGDTHTLRLDSSTPQWHYLGLTSAKLGMVALQWEHGAL